MKRILFSLSMLLSAGYASAQGYYPPPGMGTPMPTMPPAPPPTSAPPTYPTYSPYSAPAYPTTGAGYDPYAYGAPMPPPAADPSYGYGAPYGGGSGYGSVVGRPIINYGFLEGKYRFFNPTQDGIDGANGIGIALSAQLFKPMFLKGSFDWAKGTGDRDRSYDFAQVKGGAGLYLPIADKFHFLAEAGGIYSNLNTDDRFLDLGEVGLYVRPAIRWAPLQWLELQAGVTVSTMHDYNSKIVDLAAYFRIFSQFDLGVGADLGDEIDSFHGGVRFRW